MDCFLYIWNPAKWRWPDLSEATLRVLSGEPYDLPWNCGNTKRIRVGDRFLLMRLGNSHRGIIGCGFVSSQPYERPHWDLAKAKLGRSDLGTDLLFKALSAEPIIPEVILQSRFSDYKWNPQISGLSVPSGIADELFSEIQSSDSFGFPPQSQDDIRLYAEGKVREITIRTYDRCPSARQACIEHFGYDCSVCGFNFLREFGVLGREYIEVHHLRPLADQGETTEINPLTDLRPVCANCHRMLHRQHPPLSIEELRNYRKSKEDNLI